ncbi:MAG: DUF4416 family protein [Spirochaetaceae bacterium]|nr:MAG: DUF4416 family protein [Spirochaetaceae bacterium]
MGQIGLFTLEKLVIPILISRQRLRHSLIQDLQNRYGQIDYISPDLPFFYTRYYDEEMGTPIIRFFISFLRLIDPSTLAQIKHQTNALENQYSEAGRRKINIDPGLLSLSRFILASSKEGPHRIPLREGIFAEVTLVYEKGNYRPLEWTYPDYQSSEYLTILAEIRKRYKAQLGETYRARDR